MKKIIDSCQFVVKRAKQVQINPDSLEKLSSKIKVNDQKLIPFEWKKWSKEKELMSLLVVDALNFCFWQEPKWSVLASGKRLTGSWALLSSLRKAVDERKLVLSASFLEKITQEELASVLFGENTIPLLLERTKILQEIGSVLNKKYQGKVEKIIEQGSYDAELIAEELVKSFPSFNDKALYQKKEIFFYKRAQLLALDWQRVEKKIKRVESLAALADYKVPQVLRVQGVLVYSSNLSSKIDSKKEIAQGSEEEIEIRAATVIAVDEIAKKVGCCAIEINNQLWLMAKELRDKDKPYHRTRTIYY